MMAIIDSGQVIANGSPSELKKELGNNRVTLKVREFSYQVEGENVVFDLADGASPTIIRDPADQNALYVLMPMRV